MPRGIYKHRKASEETKSRMRKNSSRFWLGKKTGIIPKFAFKKGQIPWNKGKRWVEMSERQRGENNPGWKNGATNKNKLARNSIEFALWRNAVFARDGYTCQKTGTRGGILHPHHILNFSQYPELRFAINNGITLSEQSHKQFHKKYGQKNNTKEQLKEFLINEN